MDYLKLLPDDVLFALLAHVSGVSNCASLLLAAPRRFVQKDARSLPSLRHFRDPIVRVAMRGSRPDRNDLFKYIRSGEATQEGLAWLASENEDLRPERHFMLLKYEDGRVRYLGQAAAWPQRLAENWRRLEKIVKNDKEKPRLREKQRSR